MDKEPKRVRSPKEELIRARINTPWGARPSLRRRILSDWPYHDWMTELCHGGSLYLSMPWKNYNAVLPWLSCLPEALFLSRKKEASLADMDIFRSPFSYFNLNCLVGNSISFDMSLSDLPRMEMPKRKSRAASHSNELTRLMELHDAEFSPCPLLLMNESDRSDKGKISEYIRRRPTDAYWGKISAEQKRPRTQALDRYPAHPPSRVNTFTNEI